MTKAAELAKMGEVLTNSQIGGRRNLMINGGMLVAQRGDMTGMTVSQYTTCDRFKVEMSSAGTWSTAQSTTTPDGFAKSLKLDCTTADGSLSAGDYILVSHYFEGQNLQHLKKGTSGAEKLTLSFHVRSNKTGTYIVEFYDADNSRSISKSYTIDSANTFEKKTITIDGDTSGAFDNDASGSLGIFFYLGAGSNFTSGTLNTSWGSRTLANVAVGQVNLADSTDNEILITGVQLEVGSQATPFEHRQYGEELNLAKRYFERMFRGGNAPNGTEISIVSSGVWYGAGHVLADFRYSPKRASPTISISETGVIGFYGNNYFRTSSDSSPFDMITSGAARVNINSWNANGTAGDGAFGILVNDNVSNVSIDAEL